MTKSIRLTREDWLETGLQLLSDCGEQALTIERLCQATSRTKGSFYHHFKDRDDFVNSLLEYWQSKYTDQIIIAVERLKDPIAQRRELDRLAANVDNQLERVIRNWSGVDERVRQTIRQVDDKRIKYLTNLIGKLAQIDSTKASELAIVEYAAFLGLQHLLPNADSKQKEYFITLITEIISSYCCKQHN
ncbi:MAG: TetR/AcrR family transcriptional regulator [Pleurocapsa sp. MO_226.B13]|nr:TetR/AcrR family transcriptional regulator [Pleurocapsa sp. MO_226.B13]